MKKVAVFFVILIILGGAVFLAGWAGLRLPLGASGVLRSKTHGVDEAVVKEGVFRWVWYTLIPTNSKMYVFTLEERAGSAELEGALENADAYRRFAGNAADFSWRAACNWAFRVAEDALPRLVREAGIENNDGLHEREAEIGRAIESAARSLSVTRSFFDTADMKTLENDIKTRFPEVDSIKIDLQFEKKPDLALYDQGKALYEEYLSAQHKILEPETTPQAVRSVTFQFRYDELEKLGALFTKYPLLLDYLELENR